MIDKNDRLSVYHKNYLIFRTNNISQSIFLKRKLSKNIYRNLFQALYRSSRLLRKRRWHLRFLVNFSKFLKTPFLTEHLRYCFCLYQVSCLDASSFSPWCKNTERRSFVNHCTKKWSFIKNIIYYVSYYGVLSAQKFRIRDKVFVQTQILRH